MNREPVFEWNPETGIATCSMSYNNKEIIGMAMCHPEDEDMMSEYTGCAIASMRAEIEMWVHIRDNEIKPGLNALKHLQACMVHSKNYNEKSYESKMLRRQIQNFEDDLATVKEMLAQARLDLKVYLTSKDSYYKQVRARREKAKSQ